MVAIKRSRVSSEAQELMLETMGNDLGRSLVVSLVYIPGDVIRSSGAKL